MIRVRLRASRRAATCSSAARGWRWRIICSPGRQRADAASARRPGPGPLRPTPRRSDRPGPALVRHRLADLLPPVRAAGTLYQDNDRAAAARQFPVPVFEPRKNCAPSRNSAASATSPWPTIARCCRSRPNSVRTPRPAVSVHTGGSALRPDAGVAGPDPGAPQGGLVCGLRPDPGAHRRHP